MLSPLQKLLQPPKCSEMSTLHHHLSQKTKQKETGKFTLAITTPYPHKRPGELPKGALSQLSRPTKPKKIANGFSNNPKRNYSKAQASADLKAVIGKDIAKKFNAEGEPILKTYAQRIFQNLLREGIITKKGQFKPKISTYQLEKTLKQITEATISEIFTKYYPQENGNKQLQTINFATAKLTSRIKHHLVETGLSTDFRFFLLLCGSWHG